MLHKSSKSFRKEQEVFFLPEISLKILKEKKIKQN